MAKVKILLAEDDIVAQEMLRFMLNKLPVDFKIVDDGNWAIEELKNDKFDVIILDLYMPAVSGIDAAREILKLPNSHNSKLYILTADNEDDVLEQTKGLKIDGVIQKPISKSRLEELLNVK